MKTSLDCVPCLLRQSLEAARAVTDDVGVQAHVVREVLQMLGALDLDRLPPLVAQAVHRRTHVLTGVEDPCRKAKMGRPRDTPACKPLAKGCRCRDRQWRDV